MKVDTGVFFQHSVAPEHFAMWSKFEMSLPFAKLSYVISTTTTRELYGYSNIMRVIIKLFNIRSHLWRYFFRFHLYFQRKKANIYIVLYSERKKSVNTFFFQRRLWRVKIAKFLWQLALFSHKFGISYQCWKGSKYYVMIHKYTRITKKSRTFQVEATKVIML